MKASKGSIVEQNLCNSTLNLQYPFRPCNPYANLERKNIKFNKNSTKTNFNPIFQRASMIGTFSPTSNHRVVLSIHKRDEEILFVAQFFYVLLIELRGRRKASWKERLNWKQFFIALMASKYWGYSKDVSIPFSPAYVFQADWRRKINLVKFVIFSTPNPKTKHSNTPVRRNESNVGRFLEDSLLLKRKGCLAHKKTVKNDGDCWCRVTGCNH